MQTIQAVINEVSLTGCSLKDDLVRTTVSPSTTAAVPLSDVEEPSTTLAPTAEPKPEVDSFFFSCSEYDLR